MVAGESTQAAGGDGETLVEGEFGREVGHRVLRQLRGVLGGPGLLLVQIGLEFREDLSDARREFGLLQAGAELVVGHLVQHRHGVVVEVLPTAGGEALEDVLRLLVPAPPEVPRQAVQAIGQFLQLGSGQRFGSHGVGVGLSCRDGALDVRLRAND